MNGLRATLGLLSGAFSTGAAAAIMCSVSVTPVTSVYEPTVAATNVMTGSYSVTCTRAAADPATFAWQLGVNDGVNAGFGANHVRRTGSQRYAYDTYRTAPYITTNLWGDAPATRLAGVLNFGASLSASDSGPFDIVLPGNQPELPAGTYTDTLTATLRNSLGTPVAAATFGVTVLTTNTCQISVPPGNVNFSYTSFQPSTAVASSSFGIRCTTGLPYVMALDAFSGSVLSLNYSLWLSSLFGIGTGATQTYTINGSMAGGQTGTCPTAVCTGSQTRTLILLW